MKTLTEKYLSKSAFFFGPDEGGGAAPAGGPTGVGGGEPAGGAPSESPAESDSGDFSSFGSDDDFDSVDLGAETEPSPEPPAASAPPAAPTKPAPAAAAPAKEEPPAAPAAPAPKEEPASASPPSALDSMVQSMDANEPALRDWLAENSFKLTKEEADAFELDAVANVPKLMARVAVNNMKSTLNIVKNLVPQLIAAEVAKITGTQAKAKEAIGEFYATNPHLNEKDHGALVTKWANAFRAANPKASRKEAIEYVGKAVSFETGLMPGTPAPAAAPRVAPFQPARPGGRQVAAPPEAPSAYSGLGMELDE